MKLSIPTRTFEPIHNPATGMMGFHGTIYDASFDANAWNVTTDTTGAVEVLFNVYDECDYRVRRVVLDGNNNATVYGDGKSFTTDNEYTRIARKIVAPAA